MRGLFRSVFCWTRRTDDQHIERLRQAVITFDRCRGFIVSLYVVALIIFVFGLVGLLSQLTSLVQLFGKGGVGIHFGFMAGVALGLGIGLGIGFSAFKIIHGLLEALTGLRNERLLIQIHDANQELREQLASTSQGDDESFEDGDA